MYSEGSSLAHFRTAGECGLSPARILLAGFSQRRPSGWKTLGCAFGEADKVKRARRVSTTVTESSVLKSHPVLS